MKLLASADADLIYRDNWTSPKYVLSIDHPKPDNSNS